MDKWLGYDNISLIPTQVSDIEHRKECDTSVQFGPVKLSVPLIAAPMADVSNGAMADRLFQLGSLGWIHRFQTYQEMLRQLEYCQGSCGVAISANTTTIGDWYDRGVRIFLIDSANGASKMVERTIKTLKGGYSDIFIIAGNVASWETFDKLVIWGADAIRVGIASGSVCETKSESGIFTPMATAIENIISVLGQHNKGALLIADGGIKSPGDVAKAIALGADLCMAGGIFAGTKEAPGEPINTGTHDKPQLVKLMRGSASFSVQNGKSEHVEGKETFVPYKGSVERVINRYAAGLRSSMSYHNARTLDEFRKNVKVVEIG